jgi:hypothetical protein
MNIKKSKESKKEIQQSYQETKQPNKITIAAIKEGREIARNQSIKGYR